MFVNFIEQLLNGLRTGSVYALIALGYTMVYGIAKMINFAHGDIIMVGAYALYVLAAMVQVNVPIPVAIILTIVFCAVVGIVIEKLAYKPLRSAPPLAVLIPKINLSFGPIVVSSITVVTLIVTAIAMILLTLFINKTKMGSAMRAVAEDKGAAELMGIAVNATISLTFAIGSALAAVAGILYVSQYESLSPTLGALPGIKAFVAAVLGGIGSIPGAMLGGIILGIIESLSKAYISSDLADAIVFGVLVVVLLVKPSGLLGKKKLVKV